MVIVSYFFVFFVGPYVNFSPHCYVCASQLITCLACLGSDLYYASSGMLNSTQSHL